VSGKMIGEVPKYAVPAREWYDNHPAVLARKAQVQSTLEQVRVSVISLLHNIFRVPITFFVGWRRITLSSTAFRRHIINVLTIVEPVQFTFRNMTRNSSTFCPAPRRRSRRRDAMITLRSSDAAQRRSFDGP